MYLSDIGVTLTLSSSCQVVHEAATHAYPTSSVLDCSQLFPLFSIMYSPLCFSSLSALLCRVVFYLLSLAVSCPEDSIFTMMSSCPNVSMRSLLDTFLGHLIFNVIRGNPFTNTLSFLMRSFFLASNDLIHIIALI